MLRSSATTRTVDTDLLAVRSILKGTQVSDGDVAVWARRKFNVGLVGYDICRVVKDTDTFSHEDLIGSATWAEWKSRLPESLVEAIERYERWNHVPAATDISHDYNLRLAKEHLENEITVYAATRTAEA